MLFCLPTGFLLSFMPNFEVERKRKKMRGNKADKWLEEAICCFLDPAMFETKETADIDGGIVVVGRLVVVS